MTEGTQVPGGAARPAAPRRRGGSSRRALALLLGSGLALVGVLVLGFGWLTIGVSTLRSSAAGTQPCLDAYEAGAGVSVRYELLPARAVCSREVDGVRQEVVVSSVPVAVTVAGLALAVGGGAGTLGVLLAPRLTASVARGRTPDAPAGPTAPASTT